jgi:hypothetical protein
MAVRLECARISATVTSLVSLLALLTLAAATPRAHTHPSSGRRLLVVSIDGLDWRYLANADQLGLRIPTLRRIMAEGDVIDGVVGENPTTTWAAHTTLITGVPPRLHGILENWRPNADNQNWDAARLRVRTVWQDAKHDGLSVGSVCWPVTASPEIDFDLPEYFHENRGGAVDLRSVAAKSTPGLIDRISARYPSFARGWLDDRSRTLAALYMTRDAGADLTLLHLLDLDDAEHENGPFTPESNAVLEATDELIAALVNGAPPDLTFAIVSDHGFERIDRAFNVSAWSAALQHDSWLGWLESWLPGHPKIVVTPGLAATFDPAIAEAMRRATTQPDSAFGRQVPTAELARWAPELANAAAAFEPAAHVTFVDNPLSHQLYEAPKERGGHHFWPGRPAFRSVFMLWGPHIPARHEPEASMLTIARRLGSVLGIERP